MTNPSFGSRQHSQRTTESAPHKKTLDTSSDSSSDNTGIQNKPTAGQLMRAVTQTVEGIYKQQLGQRPKFVQANLLPSKVVVWIEGSITEVEKLIFEENYEQSKLLCITLDSLMKPLVAEAIAQKTGAEVTSIVCASDYEKGCRGIIAQLSKHPDIRPSVKRREKNTTHSGIDNGEP